MKRNIRDLVIGIVIVLAVAYGFYQRFEKPINLIFNSGGELSRYWEGGDILTVQESKRITTEDLIYEREEESQDIFNIFPGGRWEFKPDGRFIFTPSSNISVLWQDSFPVNGTYRNYPDSNTLFFRANTIESYQTGHSLFMGGTLYLDTGVLEVTAFSVGTTSAWYSIDIDMGGSHSVQLLASFTQQLHRR